MRALIMAGGFGKRLRPLTDKVPKALIEVGGKPVIYWEIKWLESHGIRDFVLLGGYKAEELRKYIKSIGYSGRFEFSIEEEPLGSAGALSSARDILKDDEEFLVINGDNVTNIDVSRLKLKSGALCCVSLVPYRSHAGIARIRDDMVVSFEEKPLIKDLWINAGISLVGRELLRMLPRKGSLEIDVFPKLAREKKLSCATFTEDYFSAVDTFKDFETIDSDLKSGKAKI